MIYENFRAELVCEAVEGFEILMPEGRVSYTEQVYDHDFGPAFWDEFFASVKPLIDGLKQEGSSSEKPSSLFSYFLAMSRSHNLVFLLCREENLVPDVFSILSMKTASKAVLTCVLKLIENLLILDIELQNANNNVRKVILPNLEVLVYSLHDLFHSHHQRK
ncbi:hypothetical protein Ancab_033626, partial [Ancistrocladus abbreviatus]